MVSVERVVIGLKRSALRVGLQNHDLVRFILSAIGVKKQAKGIIIAVLQLAKNDGATPLILAIYNQPSNDIDSHR